LRVEYQLAAASCPTLARYASLNVSKRQRTLGQAEIGNSGKATTAYLTVGTAIAIALVSMLPRHTCAIGTRAENICSSRAFLILTQTGHCRVQLEWPCRVGSRRSAPGPAT
jgi:hypothetical protein